MFAGKSDAEDDPSANPQNEAEIDNMMEIKMVNAASYSKAEGYIETMKEKRKDKDKIQIEKLSAAQFGAANVCLTDKVEKLKLMIHKFSDSQRDAFRCVTAHLTNHENAKTATNKKGQLKMFVTGPGGVGKSFLIETIELFAK
jgi:hypothetical protein